jgi:hypothetical protein
MKKLFLVLTTTVMMSAYAIDKDAKKPPSDAEGEADTCQTDAGTYVHGALNFFHSMLCMGNKRFAGMAENIFYHLVVDMGLDVTPESLPADGSSIALTSKTFKNKTVTGTANAIVTGDSFFGTYDYHVTMLVDGTQFMDLRWSGKGKDSKGYLAMAPTAMKPGEGVSLGNAVLYIKWDRTVSTAQSISALASRFVTSYLGDATKDRAMYYAATYNDDTKDVTVQGVSIEGQRGTPSAFGCYTMYATGTLGGSVTVGKTKDSLNLTGHATTFADDTADTTSWDNFVGTDDKATANGTGNVGTVAAFTFGYSCNELKTTTAFASTSPDFTLTKTQVDALLP